MSATRSKTPKIGAALLFEMISQRYEHGATLITSNLPFDDE
jgi:DNA replication protein DnaC